MKNNFNVIALTCLFMTCVAQWSAIYIQSRKIDSLYENQREMLELDQIMTNNMEKIIQTQNDSL